MTAARAAAAAAGAGATPGRVLAISTASPALSLALFDDGRLVARHHAIIGRGHAEALVPAIAALCGRGRGLEAAHADAIIVDVGPGSFTGIRIGIAAARALGLAWGAPVSGCTSTALVAARAFAADPGLASVTVHLDAGRGQIFRQVVAADFSAGEIETIDGARTGAVADAHPDAGFALHLPPLVRGLPPQARYVRPPDAVLPL